MRSTLPGAAASDWLAMRPLAGTRWSAALTVVITTMGLPAAVRRARRDSAAMRGPSRHTTRRLASFRAATARARSARTRPSAPSGTPVSVSGFPRMRRSAGELGIARLCRVARIEMEVAQPPQKRRVVVCRHCVFAGNPGIEVRVGHLDEALVFRQLGIAQTVDPGVGKPAHDQVHLADAAMPGAKQQLAPPVIAPVRGFAASGHRPTPIARTGPGKDDIPTRTGAVSGVPWGSLRQTGLIIRRWRRPREGGDPYPVSARSMVLGSRLRGNDCKRSRIGLGEPHQFLRQVCPELAGTCRRHMDRVVEILLLESHLPRHVDEPAGKIG